MIDSAIAAEPAFVYYPLRMANTHHRGYPSRTSPRLPGPAFRRGFTVTELLVAIGIIAILAAIILATTSRVRESATGITCLSNLRNIGAGAQLYGIDHPQSGLILDYRFYVQLWPYVYPDRADATVVVSGDPPPLFKGTVFECPSVYEDRITPRRSYGINTNLAARFSWADPEVSARRLIPAMAQDIAPGTALIGEVGGGTSATSYLRPNTAQARHNNKMNVVYHDGSAEAVVLTPGLRMLPAQSLFWLGHEP